jgi:hypothetical protein
MMTERQRLHAQGFSRAGGKANLFLQGMTDAKRTRGGSSAHFRDSAQSLDCMASARTPMMPSVGAQMPIMIAIS